MNAARASLHVANGVLTAARHTYKLGSQAASAVAKLGINGLISIREFRFDVGLRSAGSGHFSGMLRAKFLGHAEVNLRLNINVRDIRGAIRQIAENIGRGFSSLFG